MARRRRRQRATSTSSAGIAVVALGHRHPAPLAAAHAQLDRLWHASNLFWTEPMQRARGEALASASAARSAFFCNSGAEANEAALKYARKATGRTGRGRARELVPRAHGGRALGHRAAREARRVRAARSRASRFATPNDIAALDAVDGRRRRRSCSSRCRARAACIPLAAGVPRRGARARRRARRAARLRRGADRRRPHAATFFALEQLGVKPDVVTLAKGLANGLPIGVPARRRRRAPAAFVPGDHGSTFGGNPVVVRRRVRGRRHGRRRRCSRSVRDVRRAAAPARARRRRRGARPRAPARRRARPAGRPGRRRGARRRPRRRHRRRARRCGSRRRSSITAARPTQALAILAEVLA